MKKKERKRWKEGKKKEGREKEKGRREEGEEEGRREGRGAREVIKSDPGTISLCIERRVVSQYVPFEWLHE